MGNQNAENALADNDNGNDNDSILAPSFVPFAAASDNDNKNTATSNKMNKYSSWPPKTKQGKQRKKNRRKQMNEPAEPENLAKIYEEQQRRDQEVKQTQAQPQEHAFPSAS